MRPADYISLNKIAVIENDKGASSFRLLYSKRRLSTE